MALDPRVDDLLRRVEEVETRLADEGGGDRIKRLDDSQAHQAEAIYGLAQIVSDDKPEHSAAAGVRTQINAVNPGKFVFPPKANAPVPSSPAQRVFSVWTGAKIPDQYREVSRVASDIKALAAKTGRQWDRLEWIFKAGEAGSWQYELTQSYLSPENMSDMLVLQKVGREVGIEVIPFVNCRGQQEWNLAEWRQYALLAANFERVVLNLEPGNQFWDNPRAREVAWHVAWWEGLRRESPTGVFELAAIPRVAQITELGGVPALKVWMTECKYASWECYANQDRLLRPDIALPLIASSFQETNPDKLIPICVWSGFEWWAKNDAQHVRDRLEVWTINAD